MTIQRKRYPLLSSRLLSCLFGLALLLCGCSLGDGEEVSGQGLESFPPVPLRLDTDPSLGARSFLGDAVAVSGPVIAVGAWGEGDERGATAVFERTSDGWLQVEMLQPDPVAAGDRFGHALALEGDDLLVGAPRTRIDGSPDVGAVYHFRRDSGRWHLESRLVPKAKDRPVHFGTAVAFAGATIAVVAAEPGQPTLHLYTSTGDTWELRESFPLAPDSVGHSLAASADLLAVAARRAGDPAAEGNQGVIQVFARSGDGWREVEPPHHLNPGDCFGCAVAIEGELMAIGSPGVGSGAVFLFERSTTGWSELARVEGGHGSAHFGRSLALSGDLLIVGAPGDDSAGENVGRLYLYSMAGGVLDPRTALSPDELGTASNFGSAVAAEEDWFVAGASGTERAAGAAFVMDALDSTPVPGHD